MTERFIRCAGSGALAQTGYRDTDRCHTCGAIVAVNKDRRLRVHSPSEGSGANPEQRDLGAGHLPDQDVTE